MTVPTAVVLQREDMSGMSIVDEFGEPAEADAPADDNEAIIGDKPGRPRGRPRTKKYAPKPIEVVGTSQARPSWMSRPDTLPRKPPGHKDWHGCYPSHTPPQCIERNDVPDQINCAVCGQKYRTVGG